MWQLVSYNIWVCLQFLSILTLFVSGILFQGRTVNLLFNKLDVIWVLRDWDIAIFGTLARSDLAGKSYLLLISCFLKCNYCYLGSFIIVVSILGSVGYIQYTFSITMKSCYANRYYFKFCIFYLCNQTMVPPFPPLLQHNNFQYNQKIINI